MYAVVVDVTIEDRELAERELRDAVVPGVSGVPGFVAGYWIAVSDVRGHSVVVLESEQAARAVAGQVQDQARAGVSVDDVQVGEVVAKA
jgi:hypothetical protein